MKGKTNLVALFVTLIFAALGSLPAVAAEACSCMCVGGSPKWVCTTAGFGNPPEPASCPTMSCPTDPVIDPVEDEDDPLDVGAVVPPATGLVCQRR